MQSNHQRILMVPPHCDKNCVSRPLLDLQSRSSQAEYQVATAEAHCCYLAALFSHSLSNKSHCEPKKKVHNNALMGLDTVPRTYDKVLQLADQYKSLYHPRPAGGGGGSVIFAQKGKAGGSTPASTPSLPPPRNPWNVNPTLQLARKTLTAK
jgi:hypothetical protein